MNKRLRRLQKLRNTERVCWLTIVLSFLSLCLTGAKIEYEFASGILINALYTISIVVFVLACALQLAVIGTQYELEEAEETEYGI